MCGNPVNIYKIDGPEEISYSPYTVNSTHIVSTEKCVKICKNMRDLKIQEVPNILTIMAVFDIASN